MKKVFVSGCFDMLHSGHVAFLEEASRYGELYVGIGSDDTINKLKGRNTINSEKERLYMVKSLKMVKDSWINSGIGSIDFIDDIIKLKPDIMFVNEDGYTVEKLNLCEKLNIELIISKRIPYNGLINRSTTSLRNFINIPFRLDLAGGWLDQPYVSKYYPGPVITISIEPDIEFNDRSGMASSTRAKAIDLWYYKIPEGDNEKLAKTLFCVENPPGTKYVSGSQDSIGIIFPGVNYLKYSKEQYWPEKIETVVDESVLNFIEKNLWLINLSPRQEDFNVLDNTNINEENARKLSHASENTWKSIIEKDVTKFGYYLCESFKAQITMFPNMVTPSILHIINSYSKNALGWKISGAGGGGYLVIVSETPIKNSIQIKIRRKN